SMTIILTFPVTITGAGSNHRQSGAVPCSMSDAKFGNMQTADAVGTRDEAQLLMKLAQAALEKAREARVGHDEQINEAMRALWQTIERTEKQEAIEQHACMNLSQSIGLRVFRDASASRVQMGG